MKLKNRVATATVSAAMTGALIAGVAPVAQAADAESARAGSSISTARAWTVVNQALEDARERVLATGQPQKVQLTEGVTIELALPSASQDDGSISPLWEWNWGIVSGTLYLNKAETKKVSIGTAAVAAFIQSLPIPQWVTIAVVGIAGTVVYQAGVAVNEGRCIKIKVPAPRVQRYSGEHCD